MDAKRIKLSEASGADGDANNIPIKTLRVAPVKVDMGDPMKSYFERFGTVNSVEIEKEDNADTHFALVEFKLTKSAAAVLSSNSMHYIDGCQVQVKAAEPWLQPDHILNALNDDCLRLIFKKLNQKDLTSVANVCVRFNEEAKWVFSTKFKKLDLTESTGDEIENTLKTFGSLAQSIDVKSTYCYYGSYKREVLPMIAQYCTSELKELKFCGIYFENQMHSSSVKFDSVSSKLERLTFIDCQLDGDNLYKLVSACIDLKALHIERCHQYGLLPKWPKFSKLQEFRLINCVLSNDEFLDHIFETNLKLTKISIIDREVSAKRVALMVQNNPNVLELEFIRKSVGAIDFSEILYCCSHFTSLKVLKLGLNGGSAAPLRATLIDMASIECIKLINGSIDAQFIESISKMKHLKVLELSGIDGLTDERLIVLARGLGSQFEKLELDGSTALKLTTIGLKKMLSFATKLSLLSLKSATITIDADDYKTMLATIQNRPERTALSINLVGNGGQVKVDEMVLTQNRDLFSIVEKNGVKGVIYDDSNFDFE